MTDASAETRIERARLTPKEEACLRLVARRMSSKEIAAELGIAKTSVDTYCNRAREKLGVSDRFEAARLVAPFAETVPGSGHIAEFESALASGNPPTGRPTSRARLALAALAVLVLAEASLLAGLHALELMRPHAGGPR